ncbi:MAG: HEAT repeat domain-containing protein [Planctomycetes bacterium]|nr:HEAT repeat domain-containing protein [Planctomycetota bacterium]
MRAIVLASLLAFPCMVRSATAAEERAARPLPRVPEGFSVELAAGPPLVGYPMMAGFDERGRLFIAESAGENLKRADLEQDPPNFIRLLEDTDGDGRFDKSTIFADKMTFPMGALWYRGALYVASPPNIWRLEDTDGDGVADRREELAVEFNMKFGYTGNAADVHGCFLGPCGRIYWCEGRHGHEFTDEGGHVLSKGKAARIFSATPHGRDVEIFCGGGMDNPVEVDFAETGEMFGTVNILMSQPRVDCLMHWEEGGVYPREDQGDCIAEFRRTGDLLEPMTRMGHVAVSGVTRYRSSAFGDRYRDNLFTAIFNLHKVTRSVVERSGATFVTREEDFFVSDDPDCHPTDVLEDADGSLLVIDTGGWFRIGCPTSQIAKPEIKGAIYRIRRTDGRRVRDPRGLKLDWDNLQPPELVKLVDDERFAVRERAVDRLAEIVDIRETAVLDRVILQTDGPASEIARRNAVWAWARFGEHGLGLAVVRALDDEAESVRLAAATALGTRREAAAVERLCRSVVADTPPVRRAAARALGRICESEATRDALRRFFPGEAGRQGLATGDRSAAVEALFASLGNEVTDRVLEHALIYAVIRIADREATVPFLRHESPAVRRAALIALDQMPEGRLTRELVVPLLDTDDPSLQRTALEIIGRHEGWARETLDLLRGWLAEAALPAEREAVLRGVLLAQSGDEAVQQLVAEALSASSTAAPVRLLLLEVVQRSPVETLPARWLEVLRQILESGSADERTMIAQIVQDRAIDRFDARLTAIATGASEPVELRVAALLAVGPRLKTLPDDLFRFALDQLSEDSPPLVRLAAARAVAESPLSERQLVDLSQRLDEAGSMAAPVLLRAFGDSRSETVGTALLAALSESPAASSVSPAELELLFRGFPESIRHEADALLRKLGADPEEDRRRLGELLQLSEGGSTEAGRSLFFSRKAACASCHAVGGEGGKVGPDLTQIGRIRTGRDLMEAVVFPSASSARGYRTYVIATTKGRLHTGVISRQTADTVFLRNAELAEIRIPRGEIEEMTETNVSIMPKGLDRALAPEELRNMIAYLKSLK